MPCPYGEMGGGGSEISNWRTGRQELCHLKAPGIKLSRRNKVASSGDHRSKLPTSQ